MIPFLRFIVAKTLVLGLFCLSFSAVAQNPGAAKPADSTAAKTDTAKVVLPVKGANKSAQPNATKSWFGAEITVIGADGASLQAKRNDTIRTFAVNAPELKKVLATFTVGDRVDLTYDESTNALTTLVVEIHKTTKAQRIWTLGLSVVGVLILFRVLLRKKLRTLIIGMDNRYSNSNFQIVMWFFTLIVTYVSVTIMRSLVSIDFVGGVNIPSNLLLLSGFSALTFATAKGITESKNKEAIKESLDQKEPAAEPHFPTDLFQDDTGKVDMADFQMVVITLLAVAVYTFQVFDFLGTIELHKVVTLPDVDSTILATFGLGHGAYLAKKYVGGINS